MPSSSWSSSSACRRVNLLVFGSTQGELRALSHANQAQQPSNRGYATLNAPSASSAAVAGYLSNTTTRPQEALGAAPTGSGAAAARPGRHVAGPFAARAPRAVRHLTGGRPPWHLAQGLAAAGSFSSLPARPRRRSAKERAPRMGLRRLAPADTVEASGGSGGGQSKAHKARRGRTSCPPPRAPGGQALYSYLHRPHHVLGCRPSARPRAPFASPRPLVNR